MTAENCVLVAGATGRAGRLGREGAFKAGLPCQGFDGASI